MEILLTSVYWVVRSSVRSSQIPSDPFEINKMAGITSEFSSNTPFDFPDGRVNEDLSRKMRIPQTITVPGGEEDHQSNGPKKIPGDGVPMSIPDRIELGSYSPKSDIPRDLKDEMVAVNSLSSMITPPRTLTVDDTKSAHYPQTSTAPVSGSPTAARGNRERRTNAVRDIDDERCVKTNDIGFLFSVKARWSCFAPSLPKD